jgi:hypothetical protein
MLDRSLDPASIVGLAIDGPRVCQKDAERVYSDREVHPSPWWREGSLEPQPRR